MRTKCYCGAKRINPEHSTYVKDGTPVCPDKDCEEAFESIQRQIAASKEEDNAHGQSEAARALHDVR